MTTLGLIPARGGSREIPRKNIRQIAGLPLIAWTIKAALNSTALHQVVVSSEDEEILQVAQDFGAEVPFVRPRNLAQDDTPGIAPALHALDELPTVDTLLLLQPTSPLRTSADIDAIALAKERAGAPCAVSVTKASANCNWTFEMSASGHFSVHEQNSAAAGLTRQAQKNNYALNGALYLADADWLRQEQRFITKATLMHPMPPERSIDIDSMFDWTIAELLLEKSSET